MRFFCLALALLILAPAARSDDVVVVRLKDEQKLPGRLVPDECTDQTLVIRLIRGNAKRQIPWSDIHPDAARELRIQLGFEVEVESRGMTVDAHQIRNRSGRTFTGLLTNAATAQKDGYYLLKTADGDRRITLSDVIEGPDEVRVDALEVYTPPELYAQKIAGKEPADAEDHFKLGKFASYIGMLEKAKMHYQKVLALNDGRYNPSAIERLIVRLDKRIDGREAEDALKEIRQKIHYKRFDDGVALIQAFREKWGADEDWKELVDELETELTERRADYYSSRIARKLRDTVKKIFDQKVKEKPAPGAEDDLSLREAQKFAGGPPSDEKSASYQAVVSVAEHFEITPEEVLKFWEQRSKGTAHKAFYRDGTFIVVENLADALANVKKPKGSKKGPKAPKPQPQRTPDQWWEGKRAQRKYSELRDFLYAWWAEKSGMTELLEPKQETCPTCAGKGYTQGLHTTSQGTVPFFNRCQNCHMATFWRVVQFR